MWKESEMKDAWGRRIARDMPRMPTTMRYGFYLSEWLYRFSVYPAYLLFILNFVLILKILSETYLGFGNTLLSENPLTLMVCILFPLPFVVMWVLPATLSALTHRWYYEERKEWRGCY